MSLAIGNAVFSNTLNVDRIQAIAENNDKMLRVLTLWEKIKDFFFEGETTKCIRILHDFCHPEVGATKAAVEYNFTQLKSMAKAKGKCYFEEGGWAKFCHQR